jgi:hypothetical protein
LWRGTGISQADVIGTEHQTLPIPSLSKLTSLIVVKREGNTALQKLVIKKIGHTV